MSEPVVTGGIIAAVKYLWFLIVPAFLGVAWGLRLEGTVKYLEKKLEETKDTTDSLIGEDRKFMEGNRNLIKSLDEKVDRKLDGIHDDVKKIIWRVGGGDKG